MLIQDALKPTGKAVLSGSDDFAQEHDDELMWCRIAGDAIGILACVGWKDVAMNDWQPYHEEKEIKPEKAGELWEKRECFYHTSGRQRSGGLTLHSDVGTVDMRNVIHGKNGWKREFPEVEDDSVERIEIEEVEFMHYKEELSILGIESFSDLAYKICRQSSPMRMILEIPKDKP